MNKFKQIAGVIALLLAVFPAVALSAPSGVTPDTVSAQDTSAASAHLGPLGAAGDGEGGGIVGGGP